MKNEIIDPVKLGKRLRLLRGIKTRAEMSRETGLSQARIGNYEHGVRIPNDEAKAILANYFHTTVQKLFYTHDNN